MQKMWGIAEMTIEKTCYVVVDGYHGSDGYIDGRIRIFSTNQKAEEFIKKHKETIRKGGKPGDQFPDFYDDQTIIKIEIE